MSAPAMLPLYMRSGVSCINANGDSSTIRRTALGRKGIGISSPANMLHQVWNITRTPRADMVQNVTT